MPAGAGAMPYSGGMETRAAGATAWCHCLLGMTLQVVNDGRCPTTQL
jgi:hypothetical protein